MDNKKIRCYRCDEIVGEADKICPKCGLNFDSNEPVEMWKTESDGSERDINGFKVCAIVFGILGFIGGLVMLATLEDVAVNVISIWIYVFLLIIFLWGLGEVVNNTRITKKKTEQIYELLEKQESAKSKKKTDK